ncbi:MAG TPA: ABC transporter permease subunit [Amycolatopsis sp.]|nr:ABC transporter permease subunit [Amycolatopsis sp.]
MGVLTVVPPVERQATRARPRRRRSLAPLVWIGPSLLVIALVIVYPAVTMVWTSFQKVNSIGLTLGSAGLHNYRTLLAEPSLPRVIGHTVLWVVLVVGITVVVSLALAQFLDKRFAGRRIVRWALIVPWAASLVMTATVWRYLYEGSYGMLNRVLLDLGLISHPVDWYKDGATAFWSLVVIGIVVSIPFTTYVILAGLQALPGEVFEAVRIDGAGPWQTYRSVTLPLLRPSLLVAVVLNTIYVFNSFPIIWVITGRIPGNDTDTMVTFMYKLGFTFRLDTGEAAALGVLNVLFLLMIVTFYLRRVRWTQSGDATLSSAGSPRVSISRFTGRLRVLWFPVSRALAGVGEFLQRVWSPLRRFGLPVVGVLVAAFFLAPYAVMFLSSLKSNADLFASPARYLPSVWEWGNYLEVWNKIPLGAYLVNSLVIATVSTLLVLLVSLPAAYFTARHSFRGRQVFLYVVLATQMFAPVILVIGIYREFVGLDTALQESGFGAINTYWSIIAVNVAFNLAFSIWILNGYFAGIPKEVEESAMIDGLGRFRVLIRVVLPLARPGIVTAVIFTFIQVWNEFVVAQTIFNDPTRNRETLTVGVNAFVGLYQTQYQYLFVSSIIGIVPVVLLFASIERHLVGGLTAGSLK